MKPASIAILDNLLVLCAFSERALEEVGIGG